MKNVNLFLLLLLLAAIAHGQQTGAIVGSVKDATGAVIPGAKVSITSTSTQFQRVVFTNDTGEYVAASLPIGSYAISVLKDGFQRLDRNGITLTTAATLTIELSLTIGSEAQTVEVTAQASLSQAQSGTVSSLVDSKQVVNLPLATGNFTDLVLLTPGAHTGSASNLAEGGSAYAIRGGASFSVNGSSAASNSYLVDDLYDRNQWLNTLVLVPIVDSIQEYRVLTSNFNAEYGEAAGAVTLVTTKSGSNQFHGALWEFLRNDLLNTNSYFAKRSNLPEPSTTEMCSARIWAAPLFTTGPSSLPTTRAFASRRPLRQPPPFQRSRRSTWSRRGTSVQAASPSTTRTPRPRSVASAGVLRRQAITSPTTWIPRRSS